ncbi:serum response factor-binding protein 1 isoform X1 [Polypterus senegalus]|nr:serum response factor-binding protein 1 isoform X1 [Polypterus senegalus]
MALTLNLNNEVVKMRKDVKTARALVIRKLTRHIAKLKKKKGKEGEIEKNQRRAQRLIEEIHAMKSLKPDQVTKAALQKNIIFDKVIKNPNSTILDRATARIASYPLISKKIIEIKAAIKAFKEERLLENKKLSETEEDISEKTEFTIQNYTSLDKSSQITENKLEDSEANDTLMVVKKAEVNKSVVAAEKPQETKENLNVVVSELAETVKSENILIKDDLENPTKVEPENFENTNAQNKLENVMPESEESDVEKSETDEKQEYFDDSTEERFYKQSSLSEDDGSDDDFFIGKVKRIKKRKSDSGSRVEKKNTNIRTAIEDLKATQAEVQSAESKESIKQNLKQGNLNSVFCNSLSDSKGQKSRKNHAQPQIRKGSVVPKSMYNKKPLRHPFPEKKPVNRISHTDQSLHPSWEASKRRKMQESQITAFQGKKIKFDDDI